MVIIRRPIGDRMITNSALSRRCRTARSRRGSKRDGPVRTTDTEPRFEVALQWEHGSLQTVRDGRDPIPLISTPRYPEWVGSERFLRYIHDYLGDGPTDDSQSDTPSTLREIRSVKAINRG